MDCSGIRTGSLFITYAYTGAKGAEPSGLAVVRNYENAITSVGGAVLLSDPNRWINGKITKDGLEAWAQVVKGNGKIWLRIIEKKAMEQHITADAAAPNPSRPLQRSESF